MSCDNRRFLRISSGDGKPRGVVRLEGKRTLSCEVLNKSVGGYGIGVPLDSESAFPPGRILILEVDDLVVQVKVAHVDLDPEVDRYLVGLERIAELEDKMASQQPHASWWSALWPTPSQGLGGQSSGGRDLILATLLCCSLLGCTWLPTLLDHLQGKRKSRSTSSSMISFEIPWNWPTWSSSRSAATPATTDAVAVPPGNGARANAAAAAAASATADTKGRRAAPAPK